MEGRALLNLRNNIDYSFTKVVDIILNTKGKIIVTGVGKSGHIGNKIAASLASTGTPSFFLHPSEAFHGDLGVISKNDIILAITNSGETDEILKMLPFFIDKKISIISITSNPESTLAKNSTYHLNIGPLTEACPLKLAPTTSTTLTLALGDALTIALMEGRGFKEEHFAEYHPGGNLGKRLLSKVEDYMRSTEIPIILSNTDMATCIYTINSGLSGLCIVGTLDNVEGIITDGDLRRAIEHYKKDFFDLRPTDIMTINPVFVNREMKLEKAKFLMLEKEITSLLVGSNKGLLGIVRLHDINI